MELVNEAKLQTGEPLVPERELEAVAKAIADPVRNLVFNAVVEATLDPRAEAPSGITVRRLAERIGEPKRRVRYHLEILQEQGLVEVAGKSTRGSVVERRFTARRMAFLDREDMLGLSRAQQQRVFLGCLRLIVASAAAALDAGTAVNRPDWAMIRLPLDLDRQAWEEAGERHVRFLREMEALGERAGDRLERSGEQPIRAISSSLFFEAAP